MVNAGRKRKAGGFTLIEILIATMLLALVMGFLISVFISTMRTSAIARARLQTQQEVRDTLGYVSRLLRFAGIRPVDTGIEEITDSSIIFQCDFDHDNVTDRFGIAYDEANQVITLTHWVKGVGGFDLLRGPETVAGRVEDLEFTYYTEDNEITADPDLVTAIQVSLTLGPPAKEAAAVKQAVGSLRQSTYVYCPNLAWRLTETP